MNKHPHKKVVENMREQTELMDWEIIDLGDQPFDLIADDRQIYFHLRRNADQGKLDLETAHPSNYFDSSRGIRNVASWVSAQSTVYEREEW